jgi:hypothetical protein
MVLVPADEQVDRLAAHRPGAQQVRQLREVDEPLRVPGRPVIIGPVDDPENTMVSLARLLQQGADLLQFASTGPSRAWTIERHVAAPPWLSPLLAASPS